MDEKSLRELPQVLTNEKRRVDAKFAAIEQAIGDMTDDLTFVKGKALGLEVALLTLVRHWGSEPQTVIEALHQTMEALDDPAKCPDLAGEQKRVAMSLVEQISSALHSRNR